MSAVRTFRGMDHSLKIHGFWPADAAALCLLFVVVHVLGNSLPWDLLIAGPAAWLAYRGRKRTPRFLQGLLVFLCTPRRLMVGVEREGYTR